VPGSAPAEENVAEVAVPLTDRQKPSSYRSEDDSRAEAGCRDGAGIARLDGRRIGGAADCRRLEILDREGGRAVSRLTSLGAFRHIALHRIGPGPEEAVCDRGRRRRTRCARARPAVYGVFLGFSIIRGTRDRDRLAANTEIGLAEQAKVTGEEARSGRCGGPGPALSGQR